MQAAILAAQAVMLASAGGDDWRQAVMLAVQAVMQAVTGDNAGGTGGDAGDDTGEARR